MEISLNVMPTEGLILEGYGWDILHRAGQAVRIPIDLNLGEATSCWQVTNFDGVGDRSQWAPTPKARLIRFVTNTTVLRSL